MIKNNIKLAFRNFKKDKSTFLINLIGLSTGLACAFLIGLWVNDELNFDKFHSNDEHLFHVFENQDHGDGIYTIPHTSGHLAKALSEEIPEIKFATPIAMEKEYIVALNNNNLKGRGSFVGKDFFNTFSFELTQGLKHQVLDSKNSIVISESFAEKIFNRQEDVIGQVVEWKNGDIVEQLKVSGIFKEIPFNSSLRFDFLMSIDLHESLYKSDYNWGNRILSTYVVLKNTDKLEELNKKMTALLAKKDEGTDSSLFLKKYSEIYLYGKIENGKTVGGRIEYVRLFSIVILFILLIACINFINLSTAKADKRKKEIGIKKTIGANRKSIVLQHLSESVILSFIALFVAGVLIFFMLPYFNEITGKQFAFNFDGKILSMFFGTTLLTGLLAGSYPALYLSGFNPVEVLKGKIKTSWSEFFIRKGLVVFQFSISILLIVGVLVVHQQIEFVKNKNLGFEKDNVIYFTPEGKVAEDSKTFVQGMKNIPGVLNASSSSRSMVGKKQSTSAIAWPGKTEDIQFEAVYATYDLIETLGIGMSAGRAFSKEFGEENKNIIFNEAGIKAMGIKDPIGKRIQLWDAENYLTIIGVTKDFHFESLHEKIKPMFFEFDPDDDILMAKIESGQEATVIPLLQEYHSQYNPGYDFDFSFLDETYQAQYVSESRVSVLSRYFAGLAILISCLGLFGLAAFTAQRRMKEISIRKVLGATSFSIVRLLASDFTKMVVVAILIGLPLSYFAIQSWLENFAFHIELSPIIFALAGALTLAIAWLTVSLQTVKAARVNPANSLKE